MDVLIQRLIEAEAYVKIAGEIGILAFLIYTALLFLRGTRAATILAGIVIVILSLSFLSQSLGLEVIDWIVAKIWAILAMSVIIIFQPEIRRAFAEIGRRRSQLGAAGGTRQDMELVQTLVDATFYLADRRIGALIAIEQSIGTRAYADTGTHIDAPVTSKLLSTIFFPNTPLHDGGVIVTRNGLLTAAGCIFPLTQSEELSKSLGTRHRAGVGLTEETDAVVIIVSEESGAVSLAHRGRLSRGIGRERLRRHLVNFLVKKRIRRFRLPIRARKSAIETSGGEGAS